jgi:hypothetical protein
MRLTHRRSVPVVATLLVTLALLAGCGVDSDSQVVASTETSESTDPSTSTTTTEATTTEPTDDGPGDGIGDDDGMFDDDGSTDGDSGTDGDDTIDDDGPTDDGTSDDGASDGGDLTAFCAAYMDVARLDDELGTALDDGDVAGFKARYSEYIDAVDAAAAVAPDEIFDAMNQVADILFEFSDEVEQAVTIEEIEAIPEDPAFTAGAEAFDEAESYTDENC